MSERRSSFRIDENIALEYRPVDGADLQKREPESYFENSGAVALYSEIKRLDADNAQLLYQLKNTNRALGEYLHNLNRKIELLSQQLMAEHKPPALTNITRQVNLSEGGIAFGSSNPIEAGSYISLRLTFLPSYAGLILFAKIIRCELCKAGDYQIAAKFHHPRDAQLNIIGQQIMRAQMADRRSQQAREN
jgi:hypothetical protein